MGRNMFGPQRGPWPDEDWKGWLGPNPPFHHPVFVLSHHKHSSFVMEGGTSFHFVNDGIESALKQAFAAANGKDVRVGRGASTVRQYLQANLIDELHFVQVIILFWLLPWVTRADETQNPTPDADGVLVEPSNGEIEAGTVLTFTFPTSMIETANIDLPNQPLPFTSQPALEGEFLWKSQTEGTFTVKRVRAGATYHLALAKGANDLAHQPLQPKDWSAEFKTKAFSVTTDFEVRSELSNQPQLPLETTYDVRLTDVAEHTYLQDRDSRQRYPVNVLQYQEDSAEASEFRVTPRELLPVGRTYDLILDGLVDAGSQQPLSYPRVFPAGTTAPLKIEWVGAFNHPLEEPMIEIKFNDEIDPGTITSDKIRIEHHRYLRQ